MAKSELEIHDGKIFLFYSVDDFKPATNAGGIPMLLISDAVHVHSLHTALWASEQMK